MYIAHNRKTSNGRQHSVVVSSICRMSEVNPRRAWLVLGWVTIFGWVYHFAEIFGVRKLESLGYHALLFM